MRFVKPEVRVIARPEIDWQGFQTYLESVGALNYLDRLVSSEEEIPHGELLAEAAGRACYRSWEPGLNPNVTKIREDRGQYLENILKSGHGSVLEHANFTFAFRHISRIVSHELVRHRAGTAISQESMRYVRLTDVPMWVPDWAKQDQVLMDAIKSHLIREEEFQKWLAEYFDLDNGHFEEKKHKTSFMRRFAPGGVATDMIWTANIRALRHVIETRTAPGAEEEIRLVFGRVGQIMRDECPLLFGDFAECTDGSWRPMWRKV